jgi:hypothetical protein
MRGRLLLALALGSAGAAGAGSLTLELRIFDGPEDVTVQTRIAVHRAGERSSPVVQLSAGTARLSTLVSPGIYDVQAIQLRDGRVVNIRWAERLVVMAYPDEGGHHLEVINFQNGFGALEVRRSDGAAPEADVYHPGDRSTLAGSPIAGAGYLLFVLPAGAYDLQTRGRGAPTWHTGLQVPLDRTRLWIVR